jgi:hypothetical protein
MVRRLKRELRLLAVLSLILLVLGVVHLLAGRLNMGLASIFGAVCFSGIAVASWINWRRHRPANDRVFDDDSEDAGGDD